MIVERISKQPGNFNQVVQTIDDPTLVKRPERGVENDVKDSCEYHHCGDNDSSAGFTIFLSVVAIAFALVSLILIFIDL